MSVNPPTLTGVNEQHVVFAPDCRPDVEVLIDGEWLPGELRMWTQGADGAWTANVQWQPTGVATRRIDTFPLDQVREDLIDRSQGRLSGDGVSDGA